MAKPSPLASLLPLAILLLLGPVVARASAQETGPIDVRGELFTGGELERYLRYLQVSGRTARYPWSIRGFSPEEVERLLPTDSAHPWARRYDLAPDSAGSRGLGRVRSGVDVVYNSGFAHGGNDGALWTGRGLTVAAQAGVAARYGPLSLTLAPIAFWSQNASFGLQPNGLTGEGAYRAWQIPGQIDLPQRFGDAPYARIDPGQSTLRLDWKGIAAGVSTANQAWGPADAHPVILGNNAPGFLHGFVGTARPLDLRVGDLHGRVVYGRLDQSEYSPALDGREKRFMSGVVAVFQPRWPSGLEIGGSRFFHSHWPRQGFSPNHFLRPVEGFLKVSVRDEFAESQERDEDNQLVSVFARWVLPASGFELYGEFGREDHSWDLRHFLLEPDDIGSFLLGFDKVWRRSDDGLVVLRGEVLNTEVSHLAMSDRARKQSPMYMHYAQRQGHTQRGQMLASMTGYGGGAALLATDLYHDGGRWTLAWSRTVRAYTGDYWRSGTPAPQGLDVAHSLGVESLLFRGRYDLTAGMSGVYNFNRNFQSDAFNLHLRLLARVAL